MNGRGGWAIFAAFAAAGCASFAWLFPKFDAGALEWRTSAGRSQIIAAAANIASGYGIDTAGWDFAVTSQYLPRRRLARLERPRSPVLAQFSTLQHVVHASRPNSPFRVQVVLSGDLRPVSFRSMGPRRRSGGAPPPGQRKGFRERKGPPAGQLPPWRNEAPADAAGQLKVYAGDAAGNYSRTATRIMTPEGFRSAWEWVDGAEPGIAARLEVFVRGGSVHRVEHSLAIAESVLAGRASEDRAGGSVLNAARPLFIASTMFLCCWFFFRSVAKTFVPVRFAFSLLPLFIVPLLVDSLVGPDADRMVISALQSNTTTSATMITNGVLLLLVAMAFVVLASAGRSILPDSERVRWAGLQCIYLKQYFSRQAGLSLLAGIVAGPAIAAIPLLAVLLAGRGDMAVQSLSTPMFLSSRHPWVAMLGEPLPGVALATFGFILPWALRIGRSNAAAIFSVVLYGCTAVFLFIAPAPGRSPLAIVVCILVLGGFWLTYRFAGLLGVWASGFGSAAASMSYCFVLNGHRMEAVSAAAPALLMALTGGAIAIFGKHVPLPELLESFEIQPREVIVNERARLDAEFAVATEAQQRLLPTTAPQLDGFSLAGSCAPAREVGGDLFDYKMLPGGELELCVADVSGKGVQAALYMTLTKGMLSSAHPRQLPLPALASRLNRHLLATGRRKTFVTMSLCRLDSVERKFVHIRAGHNPPLLYRASSASWSLLKPRGMGLGLASPTLFDKILEEQEVRLEPGDITVLYSDGLTEMMNSDHEQFGEHRLAEAVCSNAGRGAQSIHDAILDSVRDFQGTAEQHDDLTLLVVKAEVPLT